MNFSKDIKIHDRNYCVLGNFIKVDNRINEDEIILLLYFIDNTELVNLKKTYDDEKTAVGVFIIDNYDDLMQSTEDTKRPQMIAEIENKINNWMHMPMELLKSMKETNTCLFLKTNI